MHRRQQQLQNLLSGKTKMTDKWTIYKEFHFSASHQLTGLPEDHQCARLHGHNYILAVRISSDKLMKPGFVIDYGELGFVKYWADRMDHRHLNEVLNFNPTSERIIEFLYQVFSRELDEWFERKVQGAGERVPIEWPVFKLEVGLSETPKTWAWYTEED